ncbi:hypothetical protein QFC21_001302 [Naganishia friedmannii]|uniref:Uncharacterized protein n=1 Tax=Naganishia friedmannii TaxID=89922 RepID=A0ACC2W4E3_9TREE|nr:hypothetical protein QFC21_001302 [Naganishia friedmannii]
MARRSLRPVSSYGTSLAPEDSASNIFHYPPLPSFPAPPAFPLPMAIPRSVTNRQKQAEEDNLEYLTHHQFPLLPPSPHQPPTSSSTGARSRPSRPFSTACLSYIDEEGIYYRSPIDQLPSSSERNAAEKSNADNGNQETMRGVGGSGEQEEQEEKRKRLLTEAGIVTPVSLLPLNGNAANPMTASGGKQLKNGLLPLDNTSSLQPLRDTTFFGRLLLRRDRFEEEGGLSGHRNGNGQRQRYPVLSWLLSIAMCAVMIHQLVQNYQLQGTPIARKPGFNYMVSPGIPSTSPLSVHRLVVVSCPRYSRIPIWLHYAAALGRTARSIARSIDIQRSEVHAVHEARQGTRTSLKVIPSPSIVHHLLIDALSPAKLAGSGLVAVVSDGLFERYILVRPCHCGSALLNDAYYATNSPAMSLCSVREICGFGGIKENGVPNQWFRFILPIFLHVGIIHLLLIILVQCTLGAMMEKMLGE